MHAEPAVSAAAAMVADCVQFCDKSQVTAPEVTTGAGSATPVALTQESAMLEERKF